MKAIVVTNPYDMEEPLNNLRSSLEIDGIKLEPVGVDIYGDPRKYLSGKENVLFYRNPFIRFEAPKKYLDFAKQCNFNTLRSFKESIVIKDGFSRFSSSFIVNNLKLCYYNPVNTEPSPIILIGHRRLDYFKLALNSILFSLSENENTPIYVGLSSTTEEFRNYCIEKSKIYKNIKVFETVDNSSSAIVNLILQIENPDTFIIMEEDYILPQITKYIYPYWTKQYTHLLNSGFDLVTQMTDLSNLPYDFYEPCKKTLKLNLHVDERYVNQNLPSIGAGMGVKKGKFLKLLKESGINVVVDGHLRLNSEKIIQLNLQGYHIGWNQEMEGYRQLSDWSRFKDPHSKSEYTLINHTDNFSRIVKTVPSHLG